MSLNDKTVFFAAGGTSGHINPAITIAQGLKSKYPQVRIIFFGRKDGLEYELVQKAGFSFIDIPARGLPKRINKEAFLAVKAFLKARKICNSKISEYRPALVVATGGYVCSALVSAANKGKVPVLLHEQNAVAGRSNALFSKKAAVVCMSYETTRSSFIKAKRVVLTGNPVQRGFFIQNKKGYREDLGIDLEEKIVLILGGSLGAKAINGAILDWLEKHPEFPAHFIISAGQKQFEEAQKRADELSSLSNKKFKVTVLPYTLELYKYMGAADLLVARAGAMSCAEICASGKCCLFIPYPYAMGDHQTKNAMAIVENEAGFLCQESQLDSDTLTEIFEQLEQNIEKIEQMGKKARSLAIEDAVDRIILELEFVVNANF